MSRLAPASPKQTTRLERHAVPYCRPPVGSAGATSHLSTTSEVHIICGDNLSCHVSSAPVKWPLITFLIPCRNPWVWLTCGPERSYRIQEGSGCVHCPLALTNDTRPKYPISPGASGTVWGWLASLQSFAYCQCRCIPPHGPLSSGLLCGICGWVLE